MFKYAYQAIFKYALICTFFEVTNLTIEKKNKVKNYVCILLI